MKALCALALVCISSNSFAAAVNSVCEVKVKGAVVGKLQVGDDVSKGTVEGIEYTVLFSDPAGQMAQVAIENKVTDISTIFWTPTSAPGTFRFAVTQHSNSKTYFLICTAL